MSVNTQPPTWRTEFRLFCLAFFITFAGILTNIAGLHIVGSYLERKQEQLSAPSSDDSSAGPQLARLLRDASVSSRGIGPMRVPG